LAREKPLRRVDEDDRREACVRRTARPAKLVSDVSDTAANRRGERRQAPGGPRAREEKSVATTAAPTLVLRQAQAERVGTRRRGRARTVRNPRSDTTRGQSYRFGLSSPWPIGNMPGSEIGSLPVMGASPAMARTAASSMASNSS